MPKIPNKIAVLQDLCMSMKIQMNSQEPQIIITESP